jgi:lysophospholipase
MASFAGFRRTLPTGATFSDWTAPDGWVLRRFDCPAAGGHTRGSILFQTGRGDMIEKYLEAVAHWQAAGWAVTSLDWRGQGGSGRMAADPRVGDIDTFDRYIDGIERFFTDWSAGLSGPRVVMGHSMGGHLILRALVEGKVTADAAVLVAPMLGLHSPVGAWGGGKVAAAMARLGNPQRLAWKTNEIPAAQATRQALLTHDAVRYADESWWRTANPRLDIGPPSWRWVREAFASTWALNHDPRLGAMRVPMLMLVADADKLVDARTAIAIGARLPDCQVVRFGSESAHEILRETDSVRDRAIAAIDNFINTRVTSA